MRHAHEVLAVPWFHRPPHELSLWLKEKRQVGREMIRAKVQVEAAKFKQTQYDAIADLIKLVAEAKAGNPNL